MIGGERALVVLLLALNGVVLSLCERIARRDERPEPRMGRVGSNLALTGLLLVLNATFDRAVAVAGVRPRGEARGLLDAWHLPGWVRVVATVLVLDALAYAAHVLLHALPAAWRFHRVHHSDAHVDVTTAFRQHPLETAWRYAFVLAGALVLGASSRAVAAYLALSAINAQLEHADLRLPWGIDRAVRAVFATPAMHRVHHSRRQAETDSNYSNIFTLWDRVFGTYRPPREGERIACGLDECDAPARQRTRGLLALPFRD